jgi:hypothetical protein
MKPKFLFGLSVLLLLSGLTAFAGEPEWTMANPQYRHPISSIKT